MTKQGFRIFVDLQNFQVMTRQGKAMTKQKDKTKKSKTTHKSKRLRLRPSKDLDLDNSTPKEAKSPII
jgi:hypothetical protein